MLSMPRRPTTPYRFAARALLLLGLVAPPLGAQPITPEYGIKAQFLVNFLKYVEWPTSERVYPIVLCVAGRDVFGDAFDTLLRDVRVGGRSAVTRVILEPDPGCSAVFIPRGANRRAYLRAARGMPTLTIGETPDFLAEGGVINFVAEGDEVRFEINTDAAANAGLIISSHLRRLAVGGSPAGR